MINYAELRITCQTAGFNAISSDKPQREALPLHVVGASSIWACKRRTCREASYGLIIVVPPVIDSGRHPNNDAGWSSQVAREAHNLEVAGSNTVPANPSSSVNSLLLANPGKVRGFSCARFDDCESPRHPACARCA